MWSHTWSLKNAANNGGRARLLRTAAVSLLKAASPLSIFYTLVRDSKTLLQCYTYEYF